MTSASPFSALLGQFQPQLNSDARVSSEHSPSPVQPPGYHSAPMTLLDHHLYRHLRPQLILLHLTTPSSSLLVNSRLHWPPFLHLKTFTQAPQRPSWWPLSLLLIATVHQIAHPSCQDHQLHGLTCRHRPPLQCSLLASPPARPVSVPSPATPVQPLPDFALPSPCSLLGSPSQHHPPSSTRPPPNVSPTGLSSATHGHSNPDSLSFVQINLNNCSAAGDVLVSYMLNNHVDIALVQDPLTTKDGTIRGFPLAWTYYLSLSRNAAIIITKRSLKTIQLKTLTHSVFANISLANNSLNDWLPLLPPPPLI